MSGSYPEQGVDLTNCDLEPIHLIGCIQGFGYLLAMSSDGIFVRASHNVSDLLGCAADALVGLPVSRFFVPAAIDTLLQRVADLPPGPVERLFNLVLTPSGEAFDMALYRSGSQIVMEIEAARPDLMVDTLSLVRPMFDTVQRATSVRDICDVAARQIRRLTGFDRVKVYRFDESGGGEVIAEARGEGIDSFLGLHFPASDIPRQARQLYTRNLLRIIVDVDEVPVPVHPVLDADGQPLDLSASGLRSVSPIHIEYLRNMGVKASMSVSILRDGVLWGLFACHHYAPLRLSYPTRSAAELLGTYFASVLAQHESRAALTRRSIAAGLHDRLTAQLAGGGALLSNFDSFAETIGDVIAFDGIVGFVAGELVCRGSTPPREAFLDLARFLNTTGNGACWSTHSLVEAYPPAAGFADACAGLMAVPVSRKPRDYIVLFRREYAHDVHWGGNPNEGKTVGPLGDRLTPRQSFDLWKEEMRGQSRPWSADEAAIADSLRVALIEVILQLLDASHAEREAAAKRQADLVAELNHRVRNSLTLVAAIVSRGRRDSHSLDDFAGRISARIATLSRAHDQVNATSWQPYPLRSMIRETARESFGPDDGLVRVAGPEVLIRPSAHTTMAMVLRELFGLCGTTAGALKPVEMTLSLTPAGDLAMAWHAVVGPASDVTQDSFALAIIERLIPHELAGSAELTIEGEVVEARFVIPAERIELVATQGPDRPMRMPVVAALEPPHRLLSRRALVLEDNAIIGMESEMQLLDLGAAHVDNASTVRRALDFLGRHDYEFVLLDVNLGHESSQAVADALALRGIPHAFSTGYGEISWATGATARAPVLTKPLDNMALERAIVQAKQMFSET